MDAASNLKQQKVNKAIEELGTDLLTDTKACAFALLFKDIYRNGFRHSYSSITGIILRKYKDNPGMFENIMNNLESIELQLQSDFVQGDADAEHAINGLGKLRDHISLESIRMSQLFTSYERRNQELNQQLEDVKDTYDKAKELASRALEDSKQIKEDAQKIKMEIVSILGIFAAVVLSFMGGIGFTSSTFNGIAAASAYRVVFTAVVIGLVVFNTVAVLLYIVSRITDRPIYTKCKTDDCSCEKQCRSLNRIRKRLPFIFWVNVIFLILLIAILLGWFIGAHQLMEHIRSVIWSCKK